MNPTHPHVPAARSRREFLASAAGGTLALNWLLANDNSGKQGANAPRSPLAPKPPHFAAKAKRVIFLFMVGGPSQMDLFDPKPGLEKWAGKPLPESTEIGRAHV